MASPSTTARPVVASTAFVPGGRFQMGSEGGRADACLVHEAQVRPLRVGQCPVTNAEYAWFLSAAHAAPPPWWNDPDFRDPQQPVVGITWSEAVGYCAWLGEAIGGRWRLPTEAEWEHAARTLEPVAKARDAAPSDAGGCGPRRVGEAAPNALGLHDMGTLVREWCQDWYSPSAYLTARRYDPRGPESGDKRVRRGGAWRDAGRKDVFQRHALEPAARAVESGFRVVREVP